MITEPTPAPLWRSGFLAPLELEYRDGRTWTVTSPFDYETTVLPAAAYGARILVVDVGFVTDFASIPRILWNILPPTGRYGKAAVIHDLLYRTRGLATRRQADAILFEAMTLLGVGWWTRWVIYLGVRIGGARSYKGGL